MARAYSNDLRRKLLEAHAAGKGTLRELAERFGVSAERAFKISAARKRTGSVARVPQRRGRPSRVDRVRVAKLLEAQPDITLDRLQAALEASTGVRASRTQLWRVVRALGFRLKKIRFTPRSGIRTRTSGGAASSWPSLN